jgi:hypothetical protein
MVFLELEFVRPLFTILVCAVTSSQATARQV